MTSGSGGSSASRRVSSSRKVSPCHSPRVTLAEGRGTGPRSPVPSLVPDGRLWDRIPDPCTTGPHSKVPGFDVVVWVLPLWNPDSY